nr:MAG TPA: hypothetical protein [Caudoviricetes sp.]
MTLTSNYLQLVMVLPLCYPKGFLSSSSRDFSHR